MKSRIAAAALLYLVLCASCRPAAPPFPSGAAARVVTLVAGCPCEPDGTVSACQWRRAAWAAALYHRGEANAFITSGGRAHTPHAEAEALASAMVALGVPASRIVLETQALHTDQNVGYSFVIASELGFDAIHAVSDPGHAEAMCSMAHRWGVPCIPRPLQGAAVAEMLARDPLPLQIDGLPRAEWVRRHPEPRMATSRAYTSVGYYVKTWLKGMFARSGPPVPQSREPSLTAEGS